MSRELIKPEKKAGRPKGARTALTAKVIDDILRHWKKNGANALDEMFEKDPSSYVRTIASLIPRDVIPSSLVTKISGFLLSPIC